MGLLSMMMTAVPGWMLFASASTPPAKGENVVVACSALKHAYQDYLERDEPTCVHYVYLEGSEELIHQRLAARKGHFMNPNLLHSQFETLEPPEHAVRVDVAPLPEVIVDEITRKLGLDQ